VRGYDPLRAGVATLPFAVVTGALSPVAIIVMRKAGTKLIVTTGLLLMSGGFAVAATTPQDAAYWGRIVAAMALMAAGLAFTTSPATDAIMGALPPDKAGAGSAVNDTTRELGGTLGVAIVGSVLSSAYGSHVTSSLASLGASHPVTSLASQSIEAGLAAAAHFPPAMRAAAAESARQAFMTGLHSGSWAAAAATTAGALIALAFLPARPRHPASAPSEAVPPSEAVRDVPQAHTYRQAVQK
jgi:DHA2 family multidrug resistance protein-like MFS transporter